MLKLWYVIWQNILGVWTILRKDYDLYLTTARCRQFIARCMCMGLKANIFSSFMSCFGRFSSQFLRQLDPRLLVSTATLVLESSTLSIIRFQNSSHVPVGQKDQLHNDQAHWAIPLQVCSQWQITQYHRSKDSKISYGITANKLACGSIFSSWWRP